MMVPNAHGSGFACEWEECAQSFVSLSDLGAHIKNDHILEQKKQVGGSSARVLSSAQQQCNDSYAGAACRIAS